MDGNEYAAAARLRSALRRFLRESETLARAEGLTPRQYLLLLQIAGADDGHSTVSKLVERLVLTQSTVTELVQRAEHAGLVQRRTATHDARVAYLSLTDEGSRRLAAVHARLSSERARLRRLVEED